MSDAGRNGVGGAGRAGAAAEVDVELAVDLAGVRLRNPVVLAAGTAGTLDEIGELLPLSRVGALTTKSITREPRAGNAAWRVAPVKAGMLNAIGLANPGLEAFLAEHAPRAASLPCPVFASVAGSSVEEYVEVAGALDESGAFAGVELNVSCPNTHDGAEFGSDPALLGGLVRAVRGAVRRGRLLVKMPAAAVRAPLGIVELCRAAVEPEGSAPGGPNGRAGADALSIANTTPGMAIDVRTRRPKLGNRAGGLSGPAVHQIAVKLVHDAHRAVAGPAGVPIVGIGGVLRWDDAAELILAGATAVQIGTGLFVSPRSPLRVERGLRRWARRQGVGSVGELVGAIA